MPFDPGGRKDDEAVSELVGALKAEENWSRSYLRAELEQAQIDALKRYYGDKYGDEVDGRSQVTTREVFETIEWLRPDLCRVFTQGDRACDFEGQTQQDDQYADAAADYVNYVFFQDNPGAQILDAFAFDGLLHRRGVIACEWREAEYSAPQEVSGLNTLQVQQLMQDPQTEIVGQEVRQDMPDQAHPDGLFYDLKIKQVTKPARAESFTIAPEDFRIAARSDDLEAARYAGDVIRMMKGEAKRLWPDYEEEIDGYGGDTSGFASDERRAERFRDMEGWEGRDLAETGKGEAAEVQIMREFIRYDLNGDGYPEMIRCYRLGDCLLEHEEVDEHIYSSWTPIPIPHRFYGLGIPDILSDLQRVKTVLLRGMLDSVYLSVVPRVVAKQGVNLDDLLVVRPGAIIRDDTPMGTDGVTPLVTPDLSQSTLNAMQWVDRIAESRTGVNRSAQPMDPDLLHDTAKGVELLQNAASVRKEQIARNMADGLEGFFKKLYRLLCRHQNEARAVKIAGEWRNVDPRSWNSDMRVMVSTGLGTGAKEKQVMFLQMLQGDQVAAVQAFGPQNPSVSPMELYNMVSEKGRALGFKSVDKFFKPPIDPQTGQPWVPQPQPSPDQMKIQAQVQEGQARLQMDGQKAQMDAQIKQFETNAKAGADVQKAQLDAQIQQMKAEAEIQLAREKMMLEMQMKEAQMQFEMQMQERQFAFETEMQRRETDAKVEAIKKKATVSDGGGVTDTRFGGEPG